VFLEDGKCKIHSLAKPLQCTTWPFWTEVLVSERAFKEATRGCKGIGKGRTLKPRTVQSILGMLSRHRWLKVKRRT